MGAFCPQAEHLSDMHHNVPDDGRSPLSLSRGLLLQLYGGQGCEMYDMRYVCLQVWRGCICMVQEGQP